MDDWPAIVLKYTTIAQDERETRAAQLDGRRAHARATRPRAYAAQPRDSVTKATADFADYGHRIYQIRRVELGSGDVNMSDLPVSCRSSAGARNPFYRPGDTITLHALGPLRETYGIREFHATIVSIGKYDPRGLYSGRLVLDLAGSGITPDMVMASAPTSDVPSRSRSSGKTNMRRAMVHHITGDDGDDRWG